MAEKGGERPLKVMVSTIGTDMAAYRDTVLGVLSDLGMKDVRQDYSYTPSTHIIDALRELVDRADIYICLLGGRYSEASVDSSRNPQGLSSAELEFDRAVERGIRCLAFVAGEAIEEYEKILGLRPEPDEVREKRLTFYRKVTRHCPAQRFDSELALEVLLRDALTRMTHELDEIEDLSDMALYWSKKVEGKATHALVIGAEPEGTSANGICRTTAQVFAEWLTQDFRDDEFPLASVRLVANTGKIPYPATRDNAGQAIERFLARLGPDTAAIVYFCGFAGTQGELLLDDFDPSRNFSVLDLRWFVDLFQRGRIERAIFVFDMAKSSGYRDQRAGRLSNPVLYPASKNTAFMEALSSRHAAPDTYLGEKFARGRPVSRFTLALLESLGATRYDETGAKRIKDIRQPTLNLLEQLGETGLDIGVFGNLDLPFGFSAEARLDALVKPPVEVEDDGDIAPVSSSVDGVQGETSYGRSAPATETPGEESDTDFVPDDAEVDHDHLNRSFLAIVLGRRLHRIWMKTNVAPKPPGLIGALFGRKTKEPAPAVENLKAAFVVHIDAPWGGGKTTFANYLGKVLNPYRDGPGSEAQFLRKRYDGVDAGGIFLDNPPADMRPGDAKREKAWRDAVCEKYPEEARRAWIVVDFNAWRAEHCNPPWWAFYQTFRRGCFDAVRRRGTRPWVPNGTGADDHDGRFWRRHGLWLRLWLEEIGWRLASPKVLMWLLAALFSAGLLVMICFQIITVPELSAKSPKVLTDTVLRLVPAIVVGITSIVSFSRMIAESVSPGTDVAAERAGLGSDDPLNRFRKHFYNMTVKVRRPILVVIDDLDRCGPAFVVELIRGLQTLMRSPRVVFAILGEKDWIERAFESKHPDMKTIELGPEQNFGARFVEKAIQMSFVLPALGQKGQEDYVRQILMGAQVAKPVQAETVRTVKQAARAAAAEAAVNPEASLHTEAITERAIAEVAQTVEVTEEVRDRIKQEVNEAIALDAAVNADVQHLIEHHLQSLAPYFPANPRQIKRIVNTVNMYWAAVIARSDIPQDAVFLRQLGIWIIIMTEWPKTWELLVTCPELVDCLTGEDHKSDIEKLPVDILPGSADGTCGALKSAAGDPKFMQLIRGDEDTGRPPLTTKYARLMAELTPLPVRMKRLAGEVAGPIVPAGAGG